MNNSSIIKWLPQAGGSAASPFFLLAGPCAIEDEQTPLAVAQAVAAICRELSIPYIFKASYRKANRTRADSFTGIGDVRGLEILAEVRRAIGVPVVTDIHEAHEAEEAARYVDVLQIPAFLCRQTDLLVAAGQTGKVVNIKKGQFVSPEMMAFAADKVRGTGNERVLLTERGTTFGYQDLIVDYRSVPLMAQAGCPVVLDATHSLQQPNQAAGVTGGRPQLIELLCRAGIAAGIDGIFLETHPEPSRAKSDAANMLKLDGLAPMLRRLATLAQTVRELYPPAPGA